ncbi:MAG: PQQ-binding-like beta-propeller repeat protein [Planctomycetota bacterium]
MKAFRNKLLALATVILVLPAGILRTQQESSTRLFPPTSQDFQALWQELRERSEEGDWMSVLEKLETWIGLLDKPGINLVISNDAGISLGVRNALGRFVHLLPPEWKERLRERIDGRFGTQWKNEILDTAAMLTDRPRALLRHRILRDFPESTLAPRILMEEIDYRILRGEWPQAKHWSGRLLDLSATGALQLSTENKTRTLACALQADLALADSASFSLHQEQLKTLLASEPPPSRQGAAFENLLSISGESIRAPADRPRSGLSTFLDPAGYSRSAGGRKQAFRLGGVVWREQSGEEDFRRFASERRTARDGSTQGGTDIPIPYHPALAAGLLLLQHESHISAVDPGSEELRWRRFLGPRRAGYLQPVSPVTSEEICYAVHGNSVQAFSLASGAPRWKHTFTYDAQIQDLGFSPIAVPAEDPLAEKQESIITPAAGTALKGGILLPVNVRLEKQVLSYLAMINAGGQLVWKTFLGSTPNADYLGLGSNPSPPLVAGENVLYLGNRGFICSVDSEDGTIFWIKEYETLSPRGLKEAIREENRWHPNALLPIGQGTVLAAPQDSTRLLCIRASDGATTWHCPREEHSNLVGSNANACFLSGTRVRAIGISESNRGKTLWSFELGPGHTPQGRGFQLGERIFLSTREALLQLSADRGKLLARDLWDFPGAGGNMLLADTHLAVIHPGGFLLYNGLSRELERLRGRGKDSRYWLESASLNLRSGNLEAGIRQLDSWIESKPTPPAPNSSLDRLQLAIAETLGRLGEEASGELAEKLLGIRPQVENDPVRKLRANIDLGLFLVKAGKEVKALRAFHEALRSDVEKPSPETLSFRGIPGNKTVYLVDGLLPIPAEDYIRSQIESLRQSVAKPGLVFQQIEVKAGKALEGARTGGEIYGLQEVIRLYPFTEAAAEAYKELSISYLGRGNTDRAARALLSYVEDYPLRFDSIRTALRAAQLLYESGKRARAKALYEKILSEHADKRVEPVPGMEPNDTVGSYIRRRFTDPALAEVRTSDVHRLRIPLQMTWRSPADLLSPEKIFLEPEGRLPREAAGLFFTQSSEIIECRSTHTGIPAWTINLSMIPGYVIDPIQYRNFRFARSGDKIIRGAFADDLLVLHDHRNLFAVDPARGKVRWNVPVGKSSGQKTSFLQKPGPVFRQLSERIRGCLVTPGRIYLTSSHRWLYCFDYKGMELWKKELDFDPAQTKPARAGNEIFVLQQRSMIYSAFNIRDGSPGIAFNIETRFEGSRRTGEPTALGGGLCLLPLTRAVLLLDLSRRAVLWEFQPPDSTIEQVFYFPHSPGEVIAVLSRGGKKPALVGLAIEDGKEDWRYEKFEEGPSYFSIFRDEHQLFIIHGTDRLELLALEVRHIPATKKTSVSSLWPQKEIHLGTFLGRSRNRRLHILENAIIFPDPGQSISIYDRVKGTLLRPIEPNPLSSFLIEKRSYRSAAVGGHLVLLTDGGGCGFKGAPGSSTPADAARKRMALIDNYTGNRKNSGVIIDLALAYFQAGDHGTAISLLNQASRSEEILGSSDAKGREDIAFLLDGIKQEAMKYLAAREITARKIETPPTIDGRLEDSWSYAHRVLITGPRNLNLIPSPGNNRQWEGEEDLSAILYTGWDETYFYFALDVEDDVLRAYDREAENWKGDCLLIGLDPDGDGGYRQGRDDQLMTLGLTIPKRRKDAKGEDPLGGGEGGELEEDEDDQPQGLFSVKKKPDSSGAVYEVALPWSSFPRFAEGSKPSPGFSFGLSLLLTDDDTGRGATKTLSINPCHLIPRKQRNIWIWRFMIPEFFPRVKLR